MALGETYDNLEAFMVAPTEAEAEHHGFVIDNLLKADWAARKIAKARRDLAEVELTYQAERQRLDDYMDAERVRCDNDVAFLAGLLERFHRERLDVDPKAKSIALPSGAKLVARKSPDRVDVADVDAFMAWAEEAAPDTIRVKREVDKPALKRTVRPSEVEVSAGVECVDVDTGEVVPGVVWLTGETTFKVATEDEQ